MRFVVGSYTEPYGPFRAEGGGLTLIVLDPSGRLENRDCLPLANPSYVRSIGPDRVAVVLETDDTRAGIALVEVVGDSLRPVQAITAPGRIPCHLDLHPAGRWLAGACYGTGEVFALPLREDATFSEDGMTVTRHHGSSIHPRRQTGPHPHSARFSPDGRWIVVPDLGTDTVASYAFEATHGPDFSSPQLWAAPPGSGPRLPLFSPDGRYLILVEELSSAVSILRWSDGELTEVGCVSSLLQPFRGENTAAGLRWHPSGQVVGVTNRGADSIALFHFDGERGRLLPWREFRCGGSKPRDFDFSPCGRWLIAASQDSDILALFAIDPAAGDVLDTGERLVVRSPSCVRAFQ